MLGATEKISQTKTFHALTENLLRARSQGPQYHNAQIPGMPITLIPANSVTPRETPKFSTMGVANRIDAKLSAERAKSFAANS